MQRLNSAELDARISGFLFRKFKEFPGLASGVPSRVRYYCASLGVFSSRQQ